MNKEVIICLYGNIVFMDIFIIKSLIRCLIIPIQRYFKEKVKMKYVVHTYFTETILDDLAIITDEFELTELHIQTKTQKQSDLYSLLQTINLWGNTENAIIICVRLDVIMTKILSTNDLDSCKEDDTIVIPELKAQRKCFLMGTPNAVRMYIEKLQTNSHDILEYCKTQQIRIVRISIPIVRVLKDGNIHKRDYNICPYINDLIASTSTKIKPI